ncbi:MAG: hypothetical protein HZB26_02270 [Candidatus Hydrogenedentes bacterium]|nr:hypothetical protein [Candidatus Hydrogenedentota bacterium]
MAWLLGPVTLAAAESAPKPVLNEFPLAAWGQTPLNDADLKARHEAHFNIVQVPAADADAIRRAGASGFRVMLLRPEEAGGPPSDWATYARTFENVAGWALGDAVTEAQTPQVAGWISGLRAADPSRIPMATLPPSAEGNWGKTLGELLRAGLPAIAVQRSDWRADGTDDNSGFCTDIEAVRRISAKVGVPLWGMIHVVRSGPYRWASSSDLRFQAYGYLAAGARGLCYGTQWPSLRDLATAPPDEGEETPDEAQLAYRIGYEMEAIGGINKEVLTLAPALLPLKSTGLYFVGGGFAGLPKLDGSGQLIASVTAEAALVGMLADAEGHAWAVLVNARHAKQKSAQGLKSTLRVVVDSRVSRVTEVDRVTAYAKEIPLEAKSFYITIPGGTGSLLRLETAEPRKGS